MPSRNTARGKAPGERCGDWRDVIRDRAGDLTRRDVTYKLRREFACGFANLHCKTASGRAAVSSHHDVCASVAKSRNLGINFCIVSACGEGGESLHQFFGGSNRVVESATLDQFADPRFALVPLFDLGVFLQRVQLLADALRPFVGGKFLQQGLGVFERAPPLSAFGGRAGFHRRGAARSTRCRWSAPAPPAGASARQQRYLDNARAAFRRARLRLPTFRGTCPIQFPPARRRWSRSRRRRGPARIAPASRGRPVAPVRAIRRRRSNGRRRAILCDRSPRRLRSIIPSLGPMRGPLPAFPADRSASAMLRAGERFRRGRFPGSHSIELRLQRRAANRGGW